MTPTGPLSYEVVDVFTDQPFAGNPLAVVLDAEGLSTAQLQAIAQEFNLSETAFPMPAPEGATYGLRIFTPSVELPFAGHPSVGAAWVLHRLGRIASGANVQACGAGLLPVEVSADGATLTGGTPTVGPELDPGPLLAAVGLTADDVAGPAPRACGTGIPWVLLMVRPDALDRVRPDVAALDRIDATGVSVVSWDGTAARCRVLCGGVGIVEDPATGSAALGLGVYLATTGLVGDGVTSYVVEQGVEMGRRSELRCSVSVESGRVVATTVNGSVVPVGRGEIRVP